MAAGRCRTPKFSTNVDNCGLDVVRFDDDDDEGHSGDNLEEAEDLIDGLPGSHIDWHEFANEFDDPSDSEVLEGLIEFDDSDDDLPESGFSVAIFHADFGGTGHSGEDCDPGVATVTIIVDVIGDRCGDYR